VSQADPGPFPPEPGGEEVAPLRGDAFRQSGGDAIPQHRGDAFRQSEGDTIPQLRGAAVPLRRGDAFPPYKREVAPPSGSEAGLPRVDPVPREARSFQGRRAGVVTRTAANTIDFLLGVGVITSVYVAWCALRFLVNPTHFSFPAPSFLVLLICFEVVMFGYFTITWSTTGRTYGDHQLGLRVVNFRGERLRWAGAVVRAAFCLVLPIGLYWAVISSTNRSVQDTVMRTSVIYDWTSHRQVTPQITRPG